ncbi:MAG: type VI secretion system tube protein Hcp [Haloferacaceae archaeon]
MFSPNRREFMQSTGGIVGGAFVGFPPLDGDLAAISPDDIDRSTPYVFLHLDGIPGDATAKGHEGEIVCFACRWGLDDSVGGGKGRAREPIRGHVTVLKAMDKATPLLYEATGGNRRVKTANVTLERPVEDGRTEYFVLTLEDVTVVSLETAQYGGTSFERCVLDSNGGIDIGIKTRT